MFEDSLFSSRPQRTDKRMRLLALLSVTTQVLLVAGIVLFPLFHPETLAIVSAAPRAVLIEPRPLPKPEPPKPQVVRVSNTEATHAPFAPQPQVMQMHGGSIAHSTSALTSDDAPLIATGNGMKSSSPFGTGFGADNAGTTAVRVAPAAAPPGKPATLRISRGVSAGLLLAPITPVYPAIAKAAHQGGTVLVEATIDKAGHIIGAHAVSGPIMLQQAAVEAVARAHYKPFLLSGEPTEVETTVSITFSIGG